MQKCKLGPKPTWMSRERSIGKALSSQFLTDYSAAVYADYLYAVKLAKVKSTKERKELGNPRPETEAFGKLRAQDPNVVMPIHTWINQCNDASSDGWECHNYIRHKSKHFDTEADWKAHIRECFVDGIMPNIRKSSKS